MERQQAAGNNFSVEMDDEDVCQLLPLRGDMFELEVRLLAHHPFSIKT